MNQKQRQSMGVKRMLGKMLDGWFLGKRILGMVIGIWFCSGSVFFGEAMDVAVTDGDLRSVVQHIAASAEISIVGTEQLQGRIDISLMDVTPIEAIRRIGELKGFMVIEDEGRLYIAAEDPKRGYEMEIVSPRYVRPEVLAKALQVVVAKERVRVVKESNAVVIYGTWQQRVQARKLWKALDVPARQVNVEVIVMAVQKGHMRDVGIRWDFAMGGREGLKEGGSSYAGIKMGMLPEGEPYRLLARPTLAASDQRGEAKIIARPNIVAMNGEEATILIGDKVPVLMETMEGGKTKTTIHYEEAGIKLTYEPHITEEGDIDTILKAEVSTPHMVPEMKAYRITTRQAATRMRVKAGEVVVMGGLMDLREDHTTQKIPFLGDIPLIGKLFQYHAMRKEEVELVLFIRATPLPML